MRGRVLLSVVVGCVPAVEETPQPPPPAVKLIDAAVDAPPDAPPDARVLTRPGKLSCRWQHGDATELAFTGYRFHGVVPWVGFEDLPVTSSCCLLPNAIVLCHVTQKTWNYFKAEGGTASVPLYVEHTRLFDKNGTQPFFDAVTRAFQPGPMNDPYGKASPPLFTSHVENDGNAFWIVGDRDRVCEPNRKVPCDELLVQSRGCGAYRKLLAPMVKAFCDARGPHAWQGARVE